MRTIHFLPLTLLALSSPLLAQRSPLGISDGKIDHFSVGTATNAVEMINVHYKASSDPTKNPLPFGGYRLSMDMDSPVDDIYNSLRIGICPLPACWSALTKVWDVVYN